MALIGADMARVESLLHSPVPGQDLCITQAVDGLIASGGKRFRPALTLLSSYMCQADIDQAIYVAAGIELLHTATLVHDDLIDNALMRRGAPTLNSYLPSGAVILIGDFLFARSAALVGETGHARMLQAFANTLSTICNGEIQQMFSRRDPCARFTLATYEQRIRAKTASLFALCCRAGAILAGADVGKVTALHEYGELVGMAFQIVDDVLDFVGDQNELGKPVGEDLRQGLVTLPTLYFLEVYPNHPKVMAMLEHYLLCEGFGSDGEKDRTSGQGDDIVTSTIAAIQSSGAVDRALQDARRLAQTAQDGLSIFPSSPYRDAMEDLAGFVVERSF
jgi:geranylgeranyl pyrophosphate synthase